MVDIRDIYKSWRMAYNPSVDAKTKAGKRTKICAGCEHAKMLKVVAVGSYYGCAVCKCPLSKKVFTEKNPCPLGKWTLNNP